MTGSVIVTGTAKIVPLGAKSTTGPMAIEPLGALVTTDTLEIPMLMAVVVCSALGGIVMLVPPRVWSSLGVTTIVAPAGPTDAVFTNLLATFCGALLQAASAVSASPAR